MNLRDSVVSLCLILVTFGASTTTARMAPDGGSPTPGATVGSPAHCIAAHDIGKLSMSVNNNGTFGVNYSQSGTSDYFTGETVLACEYPKGSRTQYNYGSAFWIGAVVNRDTLVSTGADGWSNGSGYELNPDEAPLGNMIYRSTIDPARPEFDGAVSEQDFVSIYSDTCTGCAGVGNDAVENRPHIPLNIEITQKSYSWSYAYAEDFVLFDYGIRNIGRDRLRGVYMGIYVDADVHDLAAAEGYDDDICGFRHKSPAHYLPSYCPPDSDVVNSAWIADNDGDLDDNTLLPVPHVTGVRIVRTPADSLEVSFNWWIGNETPMLDFGPQTRAGLRDLGTGGLGTPEGDRNKYYFLQNGEFDYDQVRTASIDPLDPIWLPPPPNFADDWATGLDTRYLLSFGPFDIEPGQTLPLSFAYVAGEDLHTDAGNINNLPDYWEEYYDNVDFSDFDLNATWADWIYDNPGVDTDKDSFYGEYKICNLGEDSSLTRVDTTYDTLPGSEPLVVDTLLDSIWEYVLADTIWFRGDGVPDFQGASPPPGPSTQTSHLGVSGLRVEPSVGTIRVIWNGAASENARDIFSREYDFEGYRVYVGRDERRLSYSVVASYDKEDYNKYVWDDNLSSFQLYESPFTLPELMDLYSNGNPDWNPLDYGRSRPFVMDGFPDSVFYFETQDHNRSILANDPIRANTPIRKIYPDAPRPWTLIVDSIPDSLYSEYFTEEGFFRYYEYEYTLHDLLATVPYWINVTAFDYGSPRSGLAALETSPTTRPVSTYPLESVGEIADQELDVFVYPNPYRADGRYRERGFEGRGESDRPVDRTRQIHFANLPPRCTIRIYSLDGDMIREIQHDIAPSDPTANHDTWNLITRNTQMVVSGLYYWTVEDDKGRTQIGKLAIIL